MSRHRNRKNAFTLLEILLVIAILVILAGSATVMLMRQFDRGRLDVARSTIAHNGTIAQALEFYKKDMGQYPEGNGEENSLKVLLTPPDGTDEAKAKNWPYLAGGEKGLQDPWGRPYRYRFPGEKNADGFDLWSVGPDGKEDSGDEVTNWESAAE